MKTGIKVREAMTRKPITVFPEDSIRDCARTMNKFDVGSVIVKDAEKVAGIITEYDVTRKVVAQGMDYDEPAGEIMETTIITVEPDADLFEAIELMKNNSIRHLPVVEKNEFFGLITVKDILKIEPQLFELLVEKLRIREASRKPAGSGSEGICETCSEYTENLLEEEGSRICEECRQ